MNKLWGGRFSKNEMNPDVMEFTSSLNVDTELAKYDCISSSVHVEMLFKSGFLSEIEKKELMEALDEVLSMIETGSFESKGAEDIHSAIQNYVESKCKDSGKKLHTARSRNEQVVNDVRLYCMENSALISDTIVDLQSNLLGLAEKTINVILPGYTHLKHAQPVLFSHLVLAYIEMLERDKERIECAEKRSDLSVMGSGAIAGSALALNRKYVAEKLGFSNISSNSIDSVSDRDFIAEMLSAISLIAVHLSRISEDLILYTTSEFGFLDIGEEFCTGSSLMPQKKNPDVLELVRGKSAQIISALNSVLVLLKGLPHAYNRDLQEDKKPLFESVKTIIAELHIMADLVKSIEVDGDATKKALNNEFIYATDLAEHLVKKNIPFKEAHKIVGSLVKHCIDKGVNISDLSKTDLKNISETLDKDILQLLNPETSVNNKKTYGSTNPEMVKKEIIAWKKKLKRV